jgi:hypothetical protein
MITNTSGWDTDCNSGNLGCLLGIRNGLAGFDHQPDWRGPVADRVFLPTSDGGSAINDCVRISYQIANIGRALSGLPPIVPKSGARFHFELPGSVQGFTSDHPQCSRIENVPGHSKEGSRSLKISYFSATAGQVIRVKTATFIPPEVLDMPSYGIMANPTLYPGQVIRCRVEASENNSSSVQCKIFISYYRLENQLSFHSGPEEILGIGKEAELTWDTRPLFQLLKGMPIAEVGLEIIPVDSENGELFIDYLTWDGTPSVIFCRPEEENSAWKKAWVSSVDYFLSSPEAFRLIQNEGVGLLIQGCQDWQDYQVSADVTPHMVKAAGIVARCQGLQRYYAFILCDDGKVKLIKNNYGIKTLAEKNQGWFFGEGANLSIKVQGNRISTYWDGFLVFDLVDSDQPILSGAIALYIEEGRTATEGVSIFPVNGTN